MNKLGNYNPVRLDSGAMERIVGGIDPQAGFLKEGIKFVGGYLASKALDATGSAAKSTDWKEHDRQIQERMEKNMRDHL